MELTTGIKLIAIPELAELQIKQIQPENIKEITGFSYLNNRGKLLRKIKFSALNLLAASAH
ncbi:hypothetical protein GCM10009096_21030 [Parasphingorhabdus litoris]|uniref:Uncharacterized protein n=1 Tax=Parasphingorhabdus litoris TaxID=394733 RepID=A0ABP3KFW8_9SPHN